MSKDYSKLAFALALAVAGMGGATLGQAQTNAPATKPAALFADTVVAKGKGFEIKRSQLDEAVISFKANLAARGQNVPPEHAAMLEQQMLDQLIRLQLILGHATDADRTAGKALAAKRLENIKTRAGSEENLGRQLKSVGMSLEDLSKKIGEEAVAETAVERELSVKVTDDEIKKFYEENPGKFEKPEQVRASHVLLSIKDATGGDLPEDKKKEKRAVAEDVLKRAKSGEDFAKLAKEYSEDPGSKEKGGEYTFGRGAMVPEFESAAFSLKTNQVSDIVTTQFGYHIIKLSEKIPAKKVELAEASDDIKDFLKQTALQKQLPAYLEKLKSEAKVEILDEKLKAKNTGLPDGHPPIDSDAQPDAKPEK
jgi:peptidyl-prolyl cis-trans isomerase C